MRWNTTWLLLGLAGALFAFIWLVERHSRPTADLGAAPPRLLDLRPAEVSSLQLRRTNLFLLRAERTNQVWNLVEPIQYPAQSFAIESLLLELQTLTGQTRIPPEELAALKRSAAHYGLDVPAATLTLQHAGQRLELLFGSKTAVGDQVYVQLLTSPVIYLVPAETFDRLPRNLDDWRDPTLVNLASLAVDRFEVRSPARGYAVHVDSTNSSFYLSKPTPARADRAKVEALLRKVETAQVAEFVTDNPRADLEPYGLQPYEAEIAFGQGTNDLIVVQFGKAPTNRPALVYARRLSQTNIVLVPKAVLDAVQTPFNELRDRRLVTFPAATVDRIEVLADEKFVVARQTNGTWMIEPPLSQVADMDAVRETVEFLVRLEGMVEKDVVTDLAAYGLAVPARQYGLFSAATNLAGAVTNRLLAQLDLGARREERVFARGVDANTVYSITRGDAEQLPSVAWQFRDRRVWTFTTNQVSRLAVRANGLTREFIRQGPAAWKLAPGSQGIINPFAVEEMMFRLGELRAQYWVDRGQRNRVRYGFREDGYRLTFELKGSDRPQVLVLEFAPPSEGALPLALAEIDGETWIFKMPPRLYFDLLANLNNPSRS